MVEGQSLESVMDFEFCATRVPRYDAVPMPAFSQFASSVGVESAFSVLAIAKRLMAAGKDVIELEIGDSPFSTPPKAIEAGVQAIRDGHSRYGPSLGIMEFRKAAAEYVNREYGLSVTGDHVVAGPGAKNFEQLFCEAFLNAGDGVLIFSPHFPTYPPNVFRRNARVVLSELKASNDFRPSLDDVRRFLASDKSPRAIFLNSPHNPTGGVATFDDLKGHRRSRARQGRRGLQRRAVRPHGLARPPSLAARGAGHARADGRRLHVQQVVQHERVASRICGQQPGDHRRVRQAHEQRAVVRAAVHADGGRRRHARRARLSRREDEGVPEEGRAARRGHEQDRRRVVR